MRDETEKNKKIQDLKKRSKQYALRVIRLYGSMPKTGAVHVITHQLLRSRTSPGAQENQFLLENKGGIKSFQPVIVFRTVIEKKWDADETDKDGFSRTDLKLF